MISVEGENFEFEFRTFVERWFRLLALGQWADSIALLDEPNNYGVRWSEAKIRKVVSEYSRGKEVEFSDPSSLTGKSRVTFGKFNDGSGYWLDCDVPLNGARSDLTAQFEFKQRGMQYAAILQDLHVL